MLYIRRDRFKGLGESIGKVAAKAPLSANQWTMLSLLLAAVSFYLITTGSFILAAAVFALTAFIDMIDGAVAREKKTVSKVGGYLDSMTDRAIEFIINLGLFAAGLPDFIVQSGAWLMSLLFFSFLSTYARAAAFEKQVFTDLKGGILEHTDRLIFFVVIIMAASISLQYASYLVAAMAVLAAVSAAQRFSKAVKG